jgi:hypothetical protein
MNKSKYIPRHDEEPDFDSLYSMDWDEIDIRTEMRLHDERIEIGGLYEGYKAGLWA